MSNFRFLLKWTFILALSSSLSNSLMGESYLEKENYSKNQFYAETDLTQESQSQVTVTVVSDPNYPNLDVDIFILKADNLGGSPKKISVLLGSRRKGKSNSTTLDVGIGDILSFEIEDGGKILPVKITSPNQIINLRKVEAFKKAGLKEIPNLIGNLYSYDIFKLNPLLIAQKTRDGGGMVKQIFEDLEPSDTDWSYTTGYPGYGMKNSFSLIISSIHDDLEVSRMVYSMSDFAKSMAFDFGFSLGLEAIGSGSIGGGFSKMFGGSNEQEHVFSYAKKMDAAYYIDLEPEKMVLTQDFIKAVEGLPVISSNKIPHSLSDAKSNKKFNKYQKFVEDWGTHYPKSVVYGAMLFSYKESNMANVISSMNSGTSLSMEAEANIKGINVGSKKAMDFSNWDKNQNKNTIGVEGTFYLGGRLDKDDSQWSPKSVQPIKIHLDTLHQLLIPTAFSSDIAPQELAVKRRMLQYALIEKLNGIPSDEANKSQRPMVFELVAKNFQLKKNPYGSDNIAQVYGQVKVDLQLNINNTSLPVQSITPWARSQNPGSRVTMRTGYTEPFGPNQKINFIFDRKDSPNISLSQCSFKISADFINWKPVGMHYCLGEGSKSLSLDKIGFVPTPFQLKLEKAPCNKDGYFNNDQDWRFWINTTVQELSYKDLGFFFPTSKNP